MTEKVMYLGPTLRGVVRTGTVFEGGIPKILATLAANRPIINNLLVSLDDAVETKKAIGTEGTAEAVAYDKIAEISKEEIEKLTKGE